jgi:hypothetical protein
MALKAKAKKCKKATGARMQSIGLLLKVLWSPGETMFLLSKNPRVLAPMLFLSLSSLVTAVAVATKAKFGEMYMNVLAQTPRAAQMPEEAKAQLERLMSLPVMQGIFIAIAGLAPLLVVVIMALIYFGLFSMIGREGDFKAFLSITAFAYVPWIFNSLAAVVRAFMVAPSSLMLDELGSLSAAAFVDRGVASPRLFALANSIDVISIWTVLLLAIGYGFVVRKSVSKTTRVAATVAMFVALRLILLLPALIFS